MSGTETLVGTHAGHHVYFDPFTRSVRWQKPGSLSSGPHSAADRKDAWEVARDHIDRGITREQPLDGTLGAP
jgi:hypothetical protein